ncbi:hypothetical protein PFISCL1PPCAC_19500 [Pristionchus fissidentatus]|uniref:Uncharacterized protein n=1 Tax=Pristionchus fissidentatus TaxID=1538716 RepID=A0AAV5W9L3_9BILA|nr:hypothetical protein PFISCL1PPCAC_19500 [Pristionchus fissidentatus]
MKLLLFFLLLIVPLTILASPPKAKDNKAKNCYAVATKCVPSEKPSTGILWKDCSEFCRKCRGKDTGECAKSDTATCKGFYCKCSGKRVDKTESLQEAATCRLGL